jgi:two-component system response regulator FixJ
MRTVVLIDDDSGVLASLDALFTTAGYDVRAFASGRDFLDQADSLTPSCIITDLRMPGMDGLELVERVRSSVSSRVPFIMISGHADVPHAVAAMRVGVVDFLVKPFPPHRLLEAVESATTQFHALQPTETFEEDRRYAALSARELQVVDLLIAGHSSKTAGPALGISPRTVDVFRGKILRKMEVSNIAALSTLVAAVRSRKP